MKKSTIDKIRQKIAVILIVLMCIESSAAIIGDSEGAAFVNKQEFEELKENLNNQIDNYNTSLGNKIDGYIANYLAGIKVAGRSILENKYELINPTWITNKRFNKSKKGNKFTGFISFAAGNFATNVAVTELEGTATAWYVNVPLVENETDQEYLYRVAKRKIGDFDNEWGLDDIVTCDYYVSVGGGGVGGRGGSFTVDSYQLYQPTYKKYEKEQQTYFGTRYDTLVINVMEADIDTKTYISTRSQINGSGNGGESIAITLNAKDLVYDDETIFCMAGGKLEADTMYCLNTASISEIGDEITSIRSNQGATRLYRHAKDETTGDFLPYWKWDADWRNYNGNTQFNTGIEACVYRHKIMEIDSTKLLQENITKIIGEKAYYYSGCPLFTSTNDGSVSFKIKFDNDSGARTKWALSDKQFKNEDNPGNCGSLQNCNVSSFIANDEEEVSVTFDIKKDTTYWIKAEPESGYTTIGFIGDIAQVGE